MSTIGDVFGRFAAMVCIDSIAATAGILVMAASNLLIVFAALM